MKTFDEIYILDLHGNSLKRETSPNGGPDENVFDIRQGVAIGIFIKHGKKEKRGVYHASLYGPREDKYRWLETNDLTSAGYQPIQPASPWYFFIPRNTSKITHYLNWPSVSDIFSVFVTGIVTARDHFVISTELNELRQRIIQFRDLSNSDEMIREKYKLKDTRGWKLSSVRNELAKDPHWDTYYQQILYRPFDVRYIYYTPKMVDWGRQKFMHHMLAGENLGLITRRQQLPDKECNYFFVTNMMISDGVIRSDNKGSESLFPLYLYPCATMTDMFDPEQERKPNLGEWLLAGLEKAYGFTPTPEEVLAYIYAVLYSPTYRQQYAEALRTDFPRIPFAKDAQDFREMAALGQELIDLHVFRKAPHHAGVKYQGQGSDTVECVCYENGRIQINNDKYFDGVTQEVWDYYIGGYKVIEKYLKDRKKREIDPKRVIEIASVIQETIRIQKEIDSKYPKIEDAAFTLSGLKKGGTKP